MTDRDHRIRERAFHLWERAGRPDHRSEEFWALAEQEIRHEDAAAAPKPKKAPKKNEKPGAPATAPKAKAAPSEKGAAKPKSTTAKATKASPPEPKPAPKKEPKRKSGK